MNKPLISGDHVFVRFTKQDGWAFKLHFEVTEGNEYSATMTPISAEVSYFEGHEQDQWPKLDFSIVKLGDPECEDCQKYNRNVNSEVPCRIHQK